MDKNTSLPYKLEKDETLYSSFKKSYMRAVTDKKSDFEWHGIELLTEYARYILELVDTYKSK